MLHMNFTTKLRICYSFHSFDDQRGTVEVIHLIPRKCGPSKKKKKKNLKFPFPAFYPFIAHNFQEKVDIETNGKMCW